MSICCLFSIAISLAALLPAAAQNTTFYIPATKEWHVPVSSKKASSQFYSAIDWEILPQIYIGASKKDIQKIIHFLSPSGKADAVFYSTSPEGSRYEIELQFSNQSFVSDISFKKAEAQQGAAANP